MRKKDKGCLDRVSEASYFLLMHFADTKVVGLHKRRYPTESNVRCDSQMMWLFEFDNGFTVKAFYESEVDSYNLLFHSLWRTETEDKCLWANPDEGACLYNVHESVMPDSFRERLHKRISEYTADARGDDTMRSLEDFTGLKFNEKTDGETYKIREMELLLSGMSVRPFCKHKVESTSPDGFSVYRIELQRVLTTDSKPPKDMGIRVRCCCKPGLAASDIQLLSYWKGSEENETKLDGFFVRKYHPLWDTLLSFVLDSRPRVCENGFW